MIKIRSMEKIIVYDSAVDEITVKGKHLNSAQIAFKQIALAK